jgi:chromosome segregation ATPase
VKLARADACEPRFAGNEETMLNPLAVPNDVLAALGSVVNIERLLDERLAAIDDRLGELDARMARLPADLERTLRPHFEAQQERIEKLHPELVANRKHAETLPGKVDGLRAEIRGVNESVGAVSESVGAVNDELRAATAQLRGVLSELNEVRETVEPLQGPAERVARLSERLPGSG